MRDEGHRDYEQGADDLITMHPTRACIKNESYGHQNFEDVSPNPVREVGA